MASSGAELEGSILGEDSHLDWDDMELPLLEISSQAPSGTLSDDPGVAFTVDPIKSVSAPLGAPASAESILGTPVKTSSDLIVEPCSSMRSRKQVLRDSQGQLILHAPDSRSPQPQPPRAIGVIFSRFILTALFLSLYDSGRRLLASTRCCANYETRLVFNIVGKEFCIFIAATNDVRSLISGPSSLHFREGANFNGYVQAWRISAPVNSRPTLTVEVHYDTDLPTRPPRAIFHYNKSPKESKPSKRPAAAGAEENVANLVPATPHQKRRHRSADISRASSKPTNQ